MKKPKIIKKDYKNIIFIENLLKIISRLVNLINNGK